MTIKFELQATIDPDTTNESFSSSDLQSLFKNRVAAVPFNLNLLKSTQHLAEILTQISLIGVSSLTERPSHLEEHLHEQGVLSVVSSSPGYPPNSSLANTTGNTVGLINRVWQLAAKMKPTNKKNVNIIRPNTSNNNPTKSIVFAN